MISGDQGKEVQKLLSPQHLPSVVVNSILKESTNKMGDKSGRNRSLDKSDLEKVSRWWVEWEGVPSFIIILKLLILGCGHTSSYSCRYIWETVRSNFFRNATSMFHNSYIREKFSQYYSLSCQLQTYRCWIMLWKAYHLRGFKKYVTFCLPFAPSWML